MGFSGGKGVSEQVDGALETRWADDADENHWQLPRIDAKATLRPNTITYFPPSLHHLLLLLLLLLLLHLLFLLLLLLLPRRFPAPVHPERVATPARKIRMPGGSPSAHFHFVIEFRPVRLHKCTTLPPFLHLCFHNCAFQLRCVFTLISHLPPYVCTVLLSRPLQAAALNTLRNIFYSLPPTLATSHLYSSPIGKSIEF
jgi:hypothetical protein